MDLKEWFANRKKPKEDQNLAPKLPMSNEEYCALWKPCFQCRELLYVRDLRTNMSVCPKCKYHFRIGADERIEQLADEGSFHELDAKMTSSDPLGFIDTESYTKKQQDAERKTGLRDAVITGVCKINGEEVALGIMDFAYFGGSMGSVVGEKVTRLIEKAIEKRIGVIIISSSGGARMQEGLLSLMQMAKTSSALKSLADEGLLYISLLCEPTFGGVTASFAMLGDIIIAEPGARIGFAGRRVIEETIRQKLPNDFQTAEYLLKHGQVDMVVDRLSLKDTLGKLLNFHKNDGNSALAGAKKKDKVGSRA